MNQEDKINEVLNKGNLEELKSVKNGYHILRGLVTEHASHKEITSINYKTELKSGVRLLPHHFFTNDGFLERTLYTYKDKPVLEIIEKYEYNAEDYSDTTIPWSKKGVISRTKTWKYYFEDGSLDNSGIEGTYKVKEKPYETDLQALIVGKKRRYNIQIILSQRIGTILVILGVFDTGAKVKEELRHLSKTYSVDFQEYEKYGSDDIYNSIEKDTLYSWFNVKVPTNQDIDNLISGNQISSEKGAMLKGAIEAYTLTNLQGLTLRQYFIEKLKGNEK